ncbi:MAG: Pterin 4 alpha carbinolamine dehydratase [Acidobacteriota bacterium]|jgi:hypothetical protein|nr:Pterin 4 alpha carbinolamine dehydratase [Acidobacteriota bacterium]
MSMNMKQTVESLGPGEVDLRRPPKPPDTNLKPERVQELLQAFPAWRLMPGGNALGRTWEFPAGFVAAGYAAFVAGFAHREGLTVFLECTGGTLSITLRSSNRPGVQGGLTEQVLGFVQALG